MLKAYSLLDKEVGYCQGLSFVAGVLLMHVRSHYLLPLLVHTVGRLHHVSTVCVGVCARNVYTRVIIYGSCF